MPSPHTTLGRGHHTHAKAPAASHTTDQGGRKGGSRPRRIDFQIPSPSCLLCLLGVYYERALGVATTWWGWQMAAMQGCCVITSLLRPSLA